MGRVAKVAFHMMALVPFVFTIGGPSPASAPSPRAAAIAQPADALSILTYNVEGLPWPVRSGRDEAAARIAERLRGLRAKGAQPHIVVVQEAFGAAQRAIGAHAGYRYIVEGPGADVRNRAAEAAADRTDRAYMASGSRLMGEGSGKWAGSGLLIFSDFPILGVTSTVFPDHACAGLDCLANKGAMIALVAVPGAPQPIALVATHLNAKTASGVSEARYARAFARQVDVLGAFLRAHLPPGLPYVMAGDTNIGRGSTRAGQFAAMLGSLARPDGHPPIRTALVACLRRRGGCSVDAPEDARASRDKGKDLQIYAAGSVTALRPTAVTVPFGTEADGSMLSDHIGYAVRYAVERVPGSGLMIASR
ncbi:endonuclease/exonuclease/phosphatase [Sphingomonas sp. AP4-R1]|uniref:endonuclease/exonuclease/phosphatase family protein n=1 Tax=Sphingomonas sp. AP4-R1 TaxID=2735134 RepID=UPI001493C5CE|nr:endonuclease/exonuclease/phosphatase family protein [Sphingomonas sp. AP4-R1]QJU56587.1 endonuclease/exonuclease/phosphatase [Sphingomonas sp. AP4-R1]